MGGLVTELGGRRLRMQIGDRVVDGQLPLILDRGRILEARRRASGWTEADDRRLGAAVHDEERFREEVAKGPSGRFCVDSYMAVAFAAVAICWPRDDREGLASLRDHGWDVVAYGEEAADWLVVDQGLAQADVARVSEELAKVIEASIPTEQEVREREGFFEGGTGKPTPRTSGSA